MLATTPAPATRQVFYLILFISTVLKLWLAAFFPFIGDEAYFYQWGAHPDWGGYYDHPPMVGWWLWGLQQLSSHPLVLRLPAVLLWIAITFGMMDLISRLSPEQSERRWLLGSLFLVLPFTWAFNLITTDTPLILFIFFSGYAFIRADQEKTWWWYAASGVLLGLALLSKYFAGLLAITYAIYLLPRQGGIPRLLLVAACALPFMLLNLAWNASHCWNNFLFNLINRNQDAHFSFEQIAQYFLMLAYLITPWTAVALWRYVRPSKLSGRATEATIITNISTPPFKNTERNGMNNEANTISSDVHNSTAVIAWLFAVPLSLFFILSFRKAIGLHWLLAFVPFVFLYAATHLQENMLQRHRTWSLWLGLPHLILLLGLIYLPTDAFKVVQLQTDIALHREGKAIVSSLKQDIPTNSALMTTSYSLSSLLGFSGKTYIPVFGVGSFHARLDDALTDFHQFNGKDIRIVSTRPMSEDDLNLFFERITIQEKVIDGAHLWVADGKQFRFPAYRERVLSMIAQRYYKTPSWLPLYGCQFLETYGFI